MRKLPDWLRKESNEQITVEESSLELDISELGAVESVESVTAEKIEEYRTDLPQEVIDYRGEKFDELLAESIEEAICSLGEPVKNAIYLHLQKDWSITKKDIPNNLEEFSQIIHKLFGLGATRLEIKFLKNLNSKIEGDIKMSECNLPISKWIVNDLSFEILVSNTRKKYVNQCEKIEELSLQKN